MTKPAKPASRAGSLLSIELQASSGATPADRIESKATKANTLKSSVRTVKSATARRADEVFQQGKRLNSDHFALHFLHRHPDASAKLTEQAPSPSFCAFVVSKRNAKHAVRRNLVRRIWREGLQDWSQNRAQSWTRDQAQRGASVEAAAAVTSLYLVIRLAKPFGKNDFQSAASALLAALIAREAKELLSRLNARFDLGGVTPNSTPSSTPNSTPSNSPPETPQDKNPNLSGAVAPSPRRA